MTLVKEIIEAILNSGGASYSKSKARRIFSYKGIPVNIFGIPKFQSYSKRTVRSTIDRLARDGVVRKELNGLVLGPKGKEYVCNKFDSLKVFSAPSEISNDKNN